MRIGNFGAVLLGFICLLISAFITAVMFGWTSPIQNLLTQIAQNMVYSALAAIAFLLLAILSFAMIRFHSKDQVAVSSSTKFGEVRISDRTIEGIVSRAAMNIDGVKEVMPRIQPLPEGIKVFIQAVTNPEFVIPQVVETLQDTVKQDVEKFTGLKVAEVKVMVQNIDTPSPIRIR